MPQKLSEEGAAGTPRFTQAPQNQISGYFKQEEERERLASDVAWALRSGAGAVAGRPAAPRVGRRCGGRSLGSRA